MIKKIKKKIALFLLWTQKWTKTDMLYLAKGGFWLTFSQVIHSISVFISAIAFSNLLSPDTYGTYKYFLSLLEIFAIATLEQMNTAVIQAVAKDKEGDVVAALKTKIKWGMWGGAASIGLSIYYLVNENITLSVIFLIAGFFIPFSRSFNIYTAYLNGKGDFKKYSIYNSITQIIIVSSLVGLIFFIKNIIIIAIVYLVMNTLASLFFFKLTLKKLPPNNVTDPDTINYGKHLSFIRSLNALANHIHYPIIFTTLGAKETAIMFLALKPVNEIKNLLKNLGVLSLPKFSRRSLPEIKKSLPEKILKFYLLIILIIIGYYFLAPYIYQYMFPQYINSIKYSRLFALSFLLFPRVFIANVMSAHIRKKEIYIKNVTSALSKITFLLILVPQFKIWGAVWAIILAFAVNGLNDLIFFLRIKKNDPNDHPLKTKV